MTGSIPVRHNKKNTVGVTLEKFIGSSIFCFFVLAHQTLAAPSALGKLPVVSNNNQTQLLRITNEGSINALLKKHGFSEKHRREILRSSPIPRELTLAKNDAYLVKIARGGERMELRIYHRFRPVAYTFWRHADRAGLLVSPLTFEKRDRTVSGSLQGSLISAIHRTTGCDELAYRFLDAYQFRYPKLAQRVRRGARYSLTYEELYDQGFKIRTGEVLKTSLQIENNTDERVFVAFKGGGAFVSPADRQQDRRFFAPVNYVKISSLFQPRRFHPITRRRLPHLGMDFELESGAPVYAIGAGRIKRFGRARGAGRYVVIDHGRGIFSYYNHLSEISPILKVAEPVTAGYQIGEVGCTGLCTRPHLHLAISQNQRFVDPLPFLKTYPYQQSLSIYQKIASLSR